MQYASQETGHSFFIPCRNHPRKAPDREPDYKGLWAATNQGINEYTEIAHIPFHVTKN